jgi:hypothetical protein
VADAGIVEGHADPRYHGTVDGIPYRSDIVSVDGCAVELFPTRGTHSVSDVARAKSRCRNAWDVVHFYVTWQIPNPR